jgi:riboflavin synthase
MFTGIVQGQAQVKSISDHSGLRSFQLQFAQGFTHDLSVGASVAVDGVCLTATRVLPEDVAFFDVMLQSLNTTTLGALKLGNWVNVERAAREGAEIGGHPLSGHVDFKAGISEIRSPLNNRVLRFAVAAPWMRYIFARGYIAINGASLTVSEASRQSDGSGWFEVWLIPETLRVTTFSRCEVGHPVNIEIERQTQVFVDTVRGAIDERLGPLLPAIETLLAQQGLSLADLTRPHLTQADQPTNTPREA